MAVCWIKKIILEPNNNRNLKFLTYTYSSYQGRQSAKFLGGFGLPILMKNSPKKKSDSSADWYNYTPLLNINDQVLNILININKNGNCVCKSTKKF